MPETFPSQQRTLLRKVEELVAQIDRAHDEPVPIHAMIDAIIKELRAELGIFGGRLYERSGDEYELKVTFPGAVPVTEAFRIPDSYAPIEQCLLRGTLYMTADDPALDPEIEAALGVTEFAAVEVGSERYVIGFDVAPGVHRDDILLSLGVLRHAVNQKIREENLESIFRQAKQIQASILPKTAPKFAAYDIAGRSDSLDSVGGDLYDFLPLTDKILGVAIADASGHGFPAALQVRDIYMGLRMGMARDLKIVRTVERLNQIIHVSTLTSRFVSLFYGELESNGLFIYVNAGHPAPFHIAADGTVTDLSEGGPILGPLAGATYDRGVVKMRPGDLLVLYTDGLTEAAKAEPGLGSHGEEFGVRRLQEVALGHRGGSAKQVVDAIFDAVRGWTGMAADDDRTVVVVTYPGD